MNCYSHSQIMQCFMVYRIVSVVTVLLCISMKFLDQMLFLMVCEKLAV